jgi:dipeptidyl aminopeptidase/acylaminoacyl peptidase
MRTKHLLWVGLVVLAVSLPLVQQRGAAQTQAEDVKADYDRANNLNQRVANKIFDVGDTWTWIDNSQKFWYRKSVRGVNQFQFVLVDPVAASKAPAFDHARLAAAISSAASGKYTATSLPFTTFTFTDNMQAIEFAIGGGGAGAGRAGGFGGGGRGGVQPAPNAPAPPRYRCTLTDYTCTRLPAPPAAAQAQGGQGRGGRQGGQGGGPTQAEPPQTRTSPDGKWEALIQNYNIHVRPVAAPGAGGGGGGRQGGGGAGAAGNAAQMVGLSFDGSEGNAYTINSLQWSPDSQKIAVFRRRPGYNRLVTYVATSPTEQLQPTTFTRFYRKPGDVVDFDQPVMFDVASKKQTVIDTSLFPNPFNNTRLEWKRDSSAFTFEYNQRGHQVYRVIEVSAATGQARTLVDEQSKTFIYYNRQAESLSPGRTFRWDSPDGREIVWMSQRDGWAHLYLYDRATGQVKNQITKGNWNVHFVDRVDEKTRQIHFRGNGMDAGKDPYFFQHFRINFDGTGLTRYTTADASHAITWSPDRQYYVDTYSRVDLPTVSELRKASDQSLVMPLEKADITELTATGWRAPEVFVAKGRDGTTDIWGIIIRPTNFDATKKYPVIENIYAGPQGSFVPKTFSTQTGMMSVAELGFIVVQVDGMGTANRSKAFHDFAFQNIGDAGFPDRILWHKAIAAKYPYYDVTRVGIYGTSAGGQNATGGMLFHPDFYKVAVSNSGCHDNRMDKIWWNEQWMGWPLGPHYAASSNMVHAEKLKGRMMLVVPELDTNVDPASTMQVVNALVRAGKEFELVVIPGADHGAGSPITTRKRNDFFVKHLRGLDPPNWNDMPVTAGAGNDDEPDYIALENELFPQVPVVVRPGGGR